MFGMDDIYKKQVEAYVDGEVSPEERQRMKETLDAFPELKAYARKVEAQKSLLKKWWDSNKKVHH